MLVKNSLSLFNQNVIIRSLYEIILFSTDITIIHVKRNEKEQKQNKKLNIAIYLKKSHIIVVK